MYSAIATDNLDEVQRIMEESSEIPSCVTVTEPDSPRIMNQHPPFVSVASYFGSLNCLQYFLDQGFDVFSPDKVFFYIYKVYFIFMEFFIYFSIAGSFCCSWWSSRNTSILRR